MSFCAGVFFMRYATSNQAYTAQSIIKYNYSQAEDGKTPSGGELDVSEIFSSSVVKQAIENLDLTVNVDTIRSGGTVTPIVPDDVAKTQAAKIEKGEDVEEYQSTEYLVTLSLSSNYDTEYARTMLDEILSCYFASFGEKYVDYYTIPNNASALDGHGYDYLEQAEILKNTVSEISSNLINCQKSHPEFISSHTGMSLSDLLDEYNYVGDVEIPYLFSEILGGKLTQNREVLLKNTRSATTPTSWKAMWTPRRSPPYWKSSRATATRTRTAPSTTRKGPGPAPRMTPAASCWAMSTSMTPK